MTDHSNSVPRVSRAEFARLAPGATSALLALGKSVEDSGLDTGLIELVKLRVSQINGCAFCVQYHVTLAREAGVAGPKLDLVAVWREAGVYTQRETAALAWAELLTHMAGTPVPDEAWEALCAVFAEAEAVQVTVAIANINAWNRIAGPLGFVPPVSGRVVSPKRMT